MTDRANNDDTRDRKWSSYVIRFVGNLGYLDDIAHLLTDIAYQWTVCRQCLSIEIPSYDPNSHCMCVAGEVYCWWQNYNPSTDPSAGPSFLPSTTIESNYTPSLEGSTDAVDSFEASGDPAEEASLEQQQGYGEINATYSSTTSQPAPTTCLVMGREYREGELLPHSTGNCIECSCGSEGRVECSPRDCVALRPEIPVAPDIPDAPDGDFEVFNLARDRGIDESF
ncbi:Kielin/chordin protein [Apis cerana cerana]|uniref:Kielin/chordin protein n=2 Tax=Apis cerana TaxID=7461 RepID=A0A2A3E3M8_APICC|nr:Kielin/chordin protein [Apis cerana cerana]